MKALSFIVLPSILTLVSERPCPPYVKLSSAGMMLGGELDWPRRCSAFSSKARFSWSRLVAPVRVPACARGGGAVRGLLRLDSHGP